ncbi:hypothetical protein J3458_004372 [Metarhizium acridum]|uniref:uncharacterized protein n=1 Tax=Metarhizium acridum TaxID=92637 RepID=UPI001C6BD28D|nr:hypothetical protein J3458_004372 [Metarhizium acridum]
MNSRRNFEEDIKEGKLDELIAVCQNWETHVNENKPVEEWFKGYCAAFHRTDEYAERIWEMGLNALLDSCSEFGINVPENEDVWTELEERCTAFQADVESVEKAAQKPAEGIPMIIAGRCKVSCCETIPHLSNWN